MLEEWLFVFTTENMRKGNISAIKANKTTLEGAKQFLPDTITVRKFHAEDCLFHYIGNDRTIKWISFKTEDENL